jgi:ADP-ribosylglycohydrolase
MTIDLTKLEKASAAVLITANEVKSNLETLVQICGDSEAIAVMAVALLHAIKKEGLEPIYLKHLDKHIDISVLEAGLVSSSWDKIVS